MIVLPLLLAALGSLLLVLFITFRWRNRFIISAASKLPCPPALPIIGNALFFIGPISTITNNIISLTTRFRGLFTIWVGPVPVFVVSSPGDVQIVLNSSNTLEKDDIYTFLKPYFGNGILTGPVHIWKKYRRLISPVLHPSNVEKFLPIFNDVSRQLTDRLEKSGSVVDPRDGIFNLAMDAVQRAIMGRDPVDNKTKRQIQYLIHEVGSMFVNRLFQVHLHVDWIFNLVYRKQTKYCLGIISEILGVIEKETEAENKHRESEVEPDKMNEAQRLGLKTFADIWYWWYSNPHERTKDHDFRNEITTMVVAATDTVIAATSFLMITLANHPEIQDKVQAEIDEVMGDSDRDVTLGDINNLTYLGQAIMESMRIHGTFPIIMRKATKSTKLSQGLLPAGSRIMLPLHAMGWDREQFPDPHLFRPERFGVEGLDDGEMKRNPYAFLPFSGGPRNCIGKNYAMVMMKTIMVHVLRKFRIKSDMKMEDMEYELKVVMFSKNPLPLQFKERPAAPTVKAGLVLA